MMANGLEGQMERKRRMSGMPDLGEVGMRDPRLLY
jgi:hypothetical protein